MLAVMPTSRCSWMICFVSIQKTACIPSVRPSHTPSHMGRCSSGPRMLQQSSQAATLSMVVHICQVMWQLQYPLSAKAVGPHQWHCRPGSKWLLSQTPGRLGHPNTFFQQWAPLHALHITSGGCTYCAATATAAAAQRPQRCLQLLNITASPMGESAHHRVASHTNNCRPDESTSSGREQLNAADSLT